METEKGKYAGGAAKKLLMPLVATAVSAAATYAGKRAPRLLEERVMPKLRDATSGTEDLASGLADRAKSAVGRGDDDGSDGGGSRRSGSRRSFSNDELEKRRRARAEQRASRRRAARSSRS